jgi:hypothetical protein
MEEALESYIHRPPSRNLQSIIASVIFRFPILLIDETLLGIRQPQRGSPAIVSKRYVCRIFVGGIVDFHQETMREIATLMGEPWTVLHLHY